MSEWQAGLEPKGLPANSELSNCEASNLFPEEKGSLTGGLPWALEEQTHEHEREQGLLGGGDLWEVQQLVLFVTT